MTSAQHQQRLNTEAASGEAEPTGGSPAVEVLVVRAGGQRVGFLAADVIEVQRMVAWEPLPGAPEAVEGVIDLRGRVVPVLGLAERLGLPSRPPELSDRLLITGTNRHVVAVRVEEATNIETVSASELTPTGEVVPSVGRVSGVLRLSDSLVVVADLEAFLSWDEAQALTDALAAVDGVS